MRYFVLMLVVACVCSTTFGLTPKKLAGPPDDFNFFSLPVPTASAIVSDGTLTPIYFPNEVIRWEADVPIDTTTLATMTIFSPLEGGLKIEVVKPTGPDSFEISEAAADKIEESYGIDGATFPSTTYLFPVPIRGSWKVIVTANKGQLENWQAETAKRDPPGNLAPAAYLLVNNDSPIKTYSYLTNYELIADKTTGIVARLFNEQQQEKADFSILSDIPSPFLVDEPTAELDLIKPNGDKDRLPMHDDGLHNDLAPNDGVFGVEFIPDQVGYYHAQVNLAGKDSTGEQISRTGQHLIYVIEDTITLPGTASGRFTGVIGQILYIDIDAKFYKPTRSQEVRSSYKVWMELWGKSAVTGKEKAVAWLGGLTDFVPTEHVDHADHDNGILTVQLDMKWALKSLVEPPYTLKNVRISDRSYSIPTEIKSEIRVKLSKEAVRQIASIFDHYDGRFIPITHEMKNGPRPEYMKNSSAKAEGLSKKLLVHGYCARDLPWPIEHFTNYEVFNGGLGKNVLHDPFAAAIAKFAEDKGVSAFSGIGHSQGGPALTHLLAYYNSGLDNAIGKEGYPIQSVGSPYQGTSLAGNAAKLGETFGIGCGSNFDLTPDGSKLWLSGIPPDARKNVYFYTTQYETGGFLNYCNLAVNIAGVRKPNDGCTEVDYAALDGGNFMGNKKGWCHAGGMKHPPQYTDISRNTELNTNSVF